MTGPGPRDKYARQAWLAAGRKPYSIQMSKLPLVGGLFDEDTHLGFQKMDPHFMWFGLVASTFELIEERPELSEDEQIGLMTGLLYSTMSMAEQKSYIQGLVDFFKAIEDPQRYADTWTTNLMTSSTPASSLTRNWYQTADPVVRDTVHLSEAMIERTIFGLGHDREDIPPVYTPIGTELRRVIDGTPAWTSPDPVYNGLADMNQHLRPPRVTYRGVDLREFTDDSYEYSAWHAWQEATGTVVGRQDLDPDPDSQDLYELTLYETLWHYYSPEGHLYSLYQEHQRLDEQAQDPQGRSEVDKWVRDMVQDYRDAAFQTVLKVSPELRIALNQGERNYLEGLVPEYKRKYGVDSSNTDNLLKLIKQLEIGEERATKELQSIAP